MKTPGYEVTLTIFISFFCIFYEGRVYADLSEKNREIAEIRLRIKHVTKNLEGLQLKKNSLRTQLKEIEKSSGEVAYKLERLKNKRLEKEQKINTIKQEILLEKENINNQKKDLQSQVRAAYAMGQSEKLKLLLNQQSPAVSGRMLVYYDYMNKARMLRVRAIEASLLILGELKFKRIMEKKNLAEIMKQKIYEQQVLAESKSEREILLKKITKDYSSGEQELSNLMLDEQRLKELIASLKLAIDDFPWVTGPTESFHQLQGKLGWPIRGKLIKKFGDKRGDRRWDGVLIRAREGAQIRAVSRGRVVYADWLRGYGLLVIIEHGEDYMTLYAFNQSMHKTVGEWVDAGDIIATVGKSGGRVDDGLYFGIRRKGKPIDPVVWCAKITNG